MERSACNRDRDFAELPREEMESLWDAVKRSEKKSANSPAGNAKIRRVAKSQNLPSWPRRTRRQRQMSDTASSCASAEPWKNFSVRRVAARNLAGSRSRKSSPPHYLWSPQTPAARCSARLTASASWATPWRSSAFAMALSILHSHMTGVHADLSRSRRRPHAETFSARRSVEPRHSPDLLDLSILSKCATPTSISTASAPSAANICPIFTASPPVLCIAAWQPTVCSLNGISSRRGCSPL